MSHEYAQRLEVASVSTPTGWGPVEVLAEVDSTNAEIARDPRPGRIVTAERQTAGRGRLGRTWETTPGTSLAVSVVVRTPSRPGWVPLVTGLAVQRAIAEVTGASPYAAPLATVLKWPNDVLAPGDGDRKLAGILCELGPAGIVVGTGINVTSARAALPVETATSLALAGAGQVSRERLLTAYLHHLQALVALVDADPGAVHAAYRSACASIGQVVDLHRSDGIERVTVTDVDDEGRLCVEGHTGPSVVAAGDVVHVRPGTSLG